MSSIIVKEEPGKRLTAAQKKLQQRQIDAAIRIQSIIRKYLAIIRVSDRAKKSWQRVFDPRFKLYFWFNNVNGQSQWTVPKFCTAVTDDDIKSSIKFEKVVRGFLGRMKVRKIVHSRYTRYYDAKLNKYYWLNNITGKTTWKASKWLIKQDVPMPPEDVMLYEMTQKIRELEKQLVEKDNEIKEVKLKRFDELEPEVMKLKIGEAKLMTRSKYMDEWSRDEVCAWLIELKMEQYTTFIQSNKVDGYVFINLGEDEWRDMGITNKFHIKKLSLALRPFRLKHENKLNRQTDDDDLISEYAASELSGVIRAEEGADFGRDNEEDDNSDMSSYSSEEEKIELTAEQKLEMALDEQNVHIQRIVTGDNINFPMIGDIVIVRYVCYLILNNKVVTSTKNGIKRKVVEFALGFGHVIKGFEKAICTMSIGERARISMTSDYAYGKDGLFPHISPNAELKFDCTLLGYRPRTPWVKPVIQDPGLSQKPYFEDKSIVNKDARGVAVDDDD